MHNANFTMLYRPRFRDPDVQLQQDKLNGQIPELLFAIAMFPDGLELTPMGIENHSVCTQCTSVTDSQARKPFWLPQ